MRQPSVEFGKWTIDMSGLCAIMSGPHHITLALFYRRPLDSTFSCRLDNDLVQ